MKEEKELSQNEILQSFNRMKREAQLMMDKISELQYELGEHELVETNMTKLDDDRAAYRLVGGVLIKQTVGEILPKVIENRNNLTTTVQNLRTALTEKQKEAAEWKKRYGIKTQQEVEMEARARTAQQQARANSGKPSGTAGGGVLA
mmetsp:Transcript_1863/g.2476  ORF Transcript_1863/g.2476 Transcript_1863/m.2476 type:complete len:147 (-) Transcript_1863:53-493(-)